MAEEPGSTLAVPSPGAALTLCPPSQGGLVPAADAVELQLESSAAEAADNRKYQNVFSVAEAQEQRLLQYGALRKKPGYDLSDPWLAVTSELDGSRPGKPCEYRKLEAGMPCQLIGTPGSVMAYLGPAEEDEGSGGSKRGPSKKCRVLLPGGGIAVHPRSQLLPLPTCSVTQGSWAMAVGLTGDMARFNGLRGICGICRRRGDGKDAFWVMFDIADAASEVPPQVELLAQENLVALPVPPVGAALTPWEARLARLAPSERPAAIFLEDEAAAEARLDKQLLGLRDGRAEEDEEDEEDEGSVDLTEDEEEGEELTIEVGSLVRAPMPGGSQLARVEQLDSSGGKATVRTLCVGIRGHSASASSSRSYALTDLVAVSEATAELEAVCMHCSKADPEAELMLCEGFGAKCSSSVHIGCLRPPLRAVPKEDWHCEACAPASAKRPRKADCAGEDSAPARPGKAGRTAEAKPKAKAKAQSKASSSRKK
eukprot:TRINITY_DN27889_c2_g1_i1.p1 TRINITY_DN27889_c2_g1~~TRINITY_DN27889_c2_g1_i1.p1  ORF type:complete len:497 (+),score=121.36 TRINITY_DN27889_c2_g1_i1:43-1491(+)